MVYQTSVVSKSRVSALENYNLVYFHTKTRIVYSFFMFFQENRVMNPENLPNVRESQIINLNVGGQLFSTTKSTLTVVGDTFFTSMLSGRIATVEDEHGAVSFFGE